MAISGRETALALARAAYARKAEDIVFLDLSGRASYCDGFLVCSGTNRRHVRAIAEGIADEMRAQGRRPVGIEGLDASRWVLLDFGDVIVHVFDEPMRGFYDLEGLWADAPRVALDLAHAPAREGITAT